MLVKPDKRRLIVLTDISSLTAGVLEPDDGQSMIRLMLYANQFDFEGLVASSSRDEVKPELIEQVVHAYGQVRDNLLLHEQGYPTADELMRVIRPGQPEAGRDVPAETSIGKDKDTEASELILTALQKDDPRPIWVTIWGGAADLAQALYRLRERNDAADLVGKLRVRAIGDQDSTNFWIKETFPDLFYVTMQMDYRGMYRGGDEALSGPAWVDEHVCQGHGPLGALYPNYDGGDIWSGRLGRVRGVKEGDTPSFLGLIQNGLDTPERPQWGGWGGRSTRDDARKMHFTDALDDYPGRENDPEPAMATVYRWRPAFQADFQSRMDWCVQPLDGANHPPVVVIEGGSERQARPGEALTFDASGSSDPDGDVLSFSWWIYDDVSPCDAPMELHGAEEPVFRLTVGEVDEPQTIHVVVSVTDDGEPALTRYGRVRVTVSP